MTVVYILVSSQKDLYYEQALISTYSLRLHNPDINAVLLVDNLTDRTLCDKRSLIREYVSEVIKIDVPIEYTPKERSRYMKTTIRKYLKGDLLFIDTDTVISGKIEIDDFAHIRDIGCVLDYHAPLHKQIDEQKIKTNIYTIFEENIFQEDIYFNSGVIFMRDNEQVRNLFDYWHHYWEMSTFERDQCFDQPALMMADRKCGHIIQEIDGKYNCQILTSIEYLHTAIIIHYFNNQWEGKEKFSPFFENNLYLKIKDNGRIPDKTKDLILNCKSAFYSPTYYTDDDKSKFLNTMLGATAYSIYKHKSISYRILSFLCNLRFKIAKFLK